MRKILDSTLVYFDHSIDRMNTYYTELDDLRSFIECFVKNDYIPSPYTVFNIERHIHLFKKYTVLIKEKLWLKILPSLKEACKNGLFLIRLSSPASLLIL